MDDSAIYNIVLGTAMVIALFVGYFKIDNLKGDLDNLIKDLESFPSCNKDRDRILFRNYFKAKIKSYRKNVGIVSGLFSGGFLFAGIVTLINGCLMLEDDSLINDLIDKTFLGQSKTVILVIVQIIIIAMVSYCSRVKVKPCFKC